MTETQPAPAASAPSATPQDSPFDTYVSPLASRNASLQMLRLWSARHKFNTWRRIWLAVAEAQHEVTKAWDTPLVTAEQVTALRAVVDRGITDAELARAAELERDLRHDVMAHVHCLGESCPEARAIIHLGCTSQDVVCNADIDTISQSCSLIDEKVVRVLDALGQKAIERRELATLGFTHYQPAQPTTVGRRCAQWAAELAISYDNLTDMNIGWWAKQRGLRGATGTQASFLHLLNGDGELVDLLELRFSTRFKSGDEAGEMDPGSKDIGRIELGKKVAGESTIRRRFYELTGQTYPRVTDTITLSCLASVASVLHKIATDLRLLSNRKEIDEPFGSKQIGSSAMPYKRNPMKCERICGLTRFVMNLVGNAYDTAATQWLERTLDDSSNRRLSLPEAFLALDGALDLMHEVASGLVVHEAMVRKNLMAELPFLATENILMEAVKAGGDRQELHEKIRVHAQAAGMRVKQEGLENDLIERLRSDDAFASVHHLLTEEELLDPLKYVGRSVEQTERFVAEVVEPLRKEYARDLAGLEASDRGV